MMFWPRNVVLLLLAMPAAAQTSASPGALPAMPAGPAPMATPSAPLPPVSMPSLTTPEAAAPATTEPNLPALPQQPQPAPAAAPSPVSTAETPFSFGDFAYSLLFSPEQVDNMKRALTSYETMRRAGGPVAIEVVEAGPPAVVMTEPVPYPTFNLHSVAFHNARDWTVWVGEFRITPRTNDQEVRVVGISPELVRFVWKPIYADVLRQRYNEKSFADTKQVSHKMTKPNHAAFDAQGGQVMFSLKPNQTFVPGYMATFEGRMNPPALAPLKPPEALDAPFDGGAAAPAATSPGASSGGLGEEEIQRMYKRAQAPPSTNPEATMDTLLQNEQQMKGFTPPRASATGK